MRAASSSPAGVAPLASLTRWLPSSATCWFAQWCCDPAFQKGKGQDERTVGYLETSFLPLREFSSLADLQSQHDQWSTDVAFQRPHRRVGAKVKEAWAVERGYLRALPDPLPDVDLHAEVRVMKDGFVRVRDVDYSVPPGLSGRRFRSAVRSTRSGSIWAANSSPPTGAPTCPPTWCWLRLTPGHCGLNAMQPNATWRPAASS